MSNPKTGKNYKVCTSIVLPTSPAPLTGLEKYWRIFALSSISSLAAFLALIFDMTSFWWSFFLREERRDIVSRPVIGSNQSEKCSLQIGIS